MENHGTEHKRMERTPFPSEHKVPNSGSDKHHQVPALQVGNEFTVKIEEMSRDGDGIVRLEGFTVFIKNTELNEEVKIRITQVMKTVAQAIRL